MHKNIIAIIKFMALHYCRPKHKSRGNCAKKMEAKLAVPVPAIDIE